MRTVIKQTVDVDQNKIQGALDNRKNGKYDISTNTCVTNTMGILSSGGIKFNKANGVVTPEQFSNELQGSGYVTAASRHISGMSSSIMGLALYRVMEQVSKLTGTNFNTAPLINKKE